MSDPDERARANTMAQGMLALVKHEDPALSIGVISGLLAALISGATVDRGAAVELIGIVAEGMRQAVVDGVVGSRMLQ